MEEGKSYQDIVNENIELKFQLEEANETINAIRTGQVDALIVNRNGEHKIFTLKTADQTYRVFIEKMTEGAVTLDGNGVILYSNSRFAAMVNRPLSKVLGTPFAEFVAPESKETFNQLFKKAWKQDCKDEILVKTDLQINVPFQLSLTTLELDEGFSMSIILTDLTSLKETQRQLKENNKQLEETNLALELSNNDLQQFASVASHDLQEPLRKIIIFSTLLKDKFCDGDTTDCSSYIDKIIASSTRMKTLIVDILNYSRLSQNNNLTEPTDLTVLIKDLLEDFELNIREKKATIHVGILPVVQVNRGQIRQVFLNLISNGLKFSKPDVPPVITINQKKAADYGLAEESYFYISVKDNGIGFDEKYAREVFTLFQRLNTKDKFEGTGIGLAITKKIIDKHQGHIFAMSHEGIGSEFVIALPIVQGLAVTKEETSSCED